MFENKKIFVFGMAKSGYEVSKLLLNRNCKVLTVDAKEQDLDHVLELKNLGGEVIITEHPEDYLDETFDYVVKNPGIKKDNICVKKASELNIKVINEIELAYHLLPNVFIIGVTGSNGKTTTTTLIYEILKEAKLNVHLGGNIGYPLSSLVNEIKENDILLMEISDHQLCDMYDFKTNISVFTNVSPTHLDFHDSYDTYKKMKMRIFNHHSKKDIAILNYDNKEEFDLTKDIPSSKYYFSTLEKKDIYLKDNHIILPEYIDIDTADLVLKGNHNYENIMATILVCKSLSIPSETVKKVLQKFSGVEHRIEYVASIDDVKFYNDSKSTNNIALITALKSFDEPIILLAGGLNRGQDYHELDNYLTNIKEVVTFGEVKDILKDYFTSMNIKCISFDTLKEAFNQAFLDKEKGDTILLSPAHASWDQYKCFEDRGLEFKEEVKKRM